MTKITKIRSSFNFNGQGSKLCTDSVEGVLISCSDKSLLRPEGDKVAARSVVRADDVNYGLLVEVGIVVACDMEGE